MRPPPRFSHTEAFGAEAFANIMNKPLHYNNVFKSLTRINYKTKNAPSHHGKERYNRDILPNLIIQPWELPRRELQP